MLLHKKSSNCSQIYHFFSTNNSREFHARTRPFGAGTDANIGGPAVGSRFPWSCRFVRFRQCSAYNRACSASFTPVFGRPVTSAAKRSVPPRAADFEYAIDGRALRRDVPPLRKNRSALRADRGNVSRVRVVDFTSSVCRREDHEYARVRRWRETARIHRRDSATPVSKVPRQETKKERQAAWEKEEEVARTGASDLTSTRPAVMFQRTLGILGVAAA